MTFVRIALLIFLTAYSFSMGQIPSNQLNGFGKLVSTLFFVFAPALYLLPTFEAWKREQPNLTTISLVNIFLGWTLIGWVVSIAMACSSKKPAQVEIVHTQYTPAPSPSQAPRSTTADELLKLASLKEKGLLTDEEFAAQKAKVLDNS